MDAPTILRQLRAGETVTIHANDSMEFMREVERLGELRIVISMEFEWPNCVMSAPEHRKEKTNSE